MSDINFDCPQCNQNLDAPPDMAGETIECPACQESIVIPAPPSAAPAGKKRVVLKKKPSRIRTTSSAAPSAPKPTLVARLDRLAAAARRRELEGRGLGKPVARALARLLSLRGRVPSRRRS